MQKPWTSLQPVWDIRIQTAQLTGDSFVSNMMFRRLEGNS